eukprot:GDKI01028527.1.p1 GENE.GDKI01028527.1~~GDKI01028527.1.p1  ORF type:complete len:196 (-),score=55.24 GDKI01028527.1:39-587(-)
MEELKQYYKELKALVAKPRQFIQQVLALACIVFSMLMLWRGLMLYTNSESPVVVVLSGSMEPGFQRGDILFLTMSEEPLVAGDVVVFKVDGRDIPIVHRIISAHEDLKGEVNLLTKGDNNPIDDRGLYARRQLWLNKQHLMGRAVGFLPYVGMVTIWLNDYPWLKFALVGAMGFFVLLGRDS